MVYAEQKRFMEHSAKIAVIGGGSWATANIKMLSDNRCEKEIFWWMRNKSAIDHLRTYGHNPNYLSSIDLKVKPENISNDLEDILQKANMILLNVPAAFLHQVLSSVDPILFKGKKIISAIKGFVPEENMIVGEYMNKCYNIPLKDIVVLSGPCHAEEVALEKLSYLTIASPDTELATYFASLISTRAIKTNISDDIYGTEYAAVLKNIYAVAAGICNGLGYGDNFQSVLISNAIREILSFVSEVHPIDRDIKESAYLGDLLVTAYSQFSRNRLFGNMIGKGYTVKSAQLEMNMIAEGYYASRCLHQINKQYKVSMPICRAVYAILYEQHSPHIEMKLLEEQLT